MRRTDSWIKLSESKQANIIEKLNLKDSIVTTIETKGSRSSESSVMSKKSDTFNLNT